MFLKGKDNNNYGYVLLFSMKVYGGCVRGKYPLSSCVFHSISYFLSFIIYIYLVQTWNSQINCLYSFILRQKGFFSSRVRGVHI